MPEKKSVQVNQILVKWGFLRQTQTNESLIQKTYERRSSNAIVLRYIGFSHRIGFWIVETLLLNLHQNLYVFLQCSTFKEVFIFLIIIFSFQKVLIDFRNFK